MKNIASILTILALVAILPGCAKAQPAPGNSLRLQQYTADSTALKTVNVPVANNGILTTNGSGSFAFTPQSDFLAPSVLTSASAALDAKITARVLTTTWNSGSTALATYAQTQAASAITTSTNFAKSYYKAGANITITSGTISATGGGGGGSTGYTPISGAITAPGKYLLIGAITNAIASPSPGMELDLIGFFNGSTDDESADYGISGIHQDGGDLENPGTRNVFLKAGYARVRLIYGTRHYYYDHDQGPTLTGWHVVEQHNTEMP